MLSEIIVASALVASPLVVLRATTGRPLWTLCVVLCSLGIALWKGSVFFAELIYLPQWTLTWKSGLLVVSWSCCTLLLGAANVFPKWGGVRTQALLSGLMLGEWGAALLWLKRVESGRERAALVALASAAALLSPIGDPALLLLGPVDGLEVWCKSLLPFAVLLGALAWRAAPSQVPGEISVSEIPSTNTPGLSSSQFVAAACGAQLLGLAAVLGYLSVLSLSVGFVLIFIAVLARMVGTTGFNPAVQAVSSIRPIVLWALVLYFGLMLVHATGGSELLAMLVEDVQYTHGIYVNPGLLLGSALSVSVVDSTAGAFFWLGLLERAPDLQLTHSRAAVLLGCTVPSLMPFVIARCTKVGIRWLALQLLLVCLIGGWLFRAVLVVL